jgi:hypothetical protein
MGRLKPLVILLIVGLVFSLSVAPRLSYAKQGGGDGDDHGHKNKHHQHDNDYEYDKHYKYDKHHKHHEEDEYGYEYEHAHHHYRGPYFTEERVTGIRNYYTQEELDSLPPGLRKHIERTGHLPPGLEKKLVVSQPLPPEYAPYLVPAPPQLVDTLGPMPPDSQLYLYNGDAVLLDLKTQAVLDVVHGVLTLTGH